MRTIIKGPEPDSLTAHRQTLHASYDNYNGKDVLRNSLVGEQHGICCYCMGRIRSDREKMRIEHWHSQSNHSDEQLNYGNLLGACLGGEGQPRRLQHCDTHKGELDLQWNPADPMHHIETRLRYEMDGSIRSDEAVFDGQLDSVLNLNLPLLKSNRRGVLDAVLAWWRRERARIGGAVPRATFERERAERVQLGGDLGPYSQVAVWWLDQRLGRMGA